MKVINKISLFLIGVSLCVAPLKAAEEETGVFTSEESVLSVEAQKGMNLFQGKERFVNGGPTCISCHNVSNKNVVPGGLFALDLTNYFEKEGSLKENVKDWLAAPAPPAMFASYSNNPLTEQERVALTAFLKYSSTAKEDQVSKKGFQNMLLGGFGGFLILLLLIRFIWSNRKKRMVKDEIFMRQAKSSDAKF